MYVVDTNVLIYAVNTAAPQHPAAHGWLTSALSQGQTVGLPWVSVLGFVRLTTNPRIMPQPISVPDALAAVAVWTSRPNAVLLEPGPRHLVLLGELLGAAGTGGNLTTDAHIAALALENRCPVATFDRGIARFGVDVAIPGQH
ncbi:MAG: type II toxin-antitoxin system VapC family toxin [Propionibacteriaceae bacterium]|nr:type II toxin-antitoxin system VapC family toxin [Propionibacteriaceae bacterium]